MKINWRYTLGELLIVTTGILIAFALNNWAAQRNDKKLEHQYLSSLRADLQADLQVLKNNQQLVQSNHEKARSIIRHFFAELPGRDSIPMKVFSELKGMPSFIPHDATFQTLKNTGDFKLIQDFELKNSLVEHYSRYNEIFMEDERNKAFLRDHVSAYFMNEASFEQIYRQSDRLLTDFRMKNIVYAWFGIYQIQEQILQRAIDRTEALLASMETQL
jgi:hypothetical protein